MFQSRSQTFGRLNLAVSEHIRLKLVLECCLMEGNLPLYAIAVGPMVDECPLYRVAFGALLLDSQQSKSGIRPYATCFTPRKTGRFLKHRCGL